MNILKSFKIVVIVATILFAQIPQFCKANFTLQEISQEAGKKLIIGAFAMTSGLFLYQGAKQFFFPPILCKNNTTSTGRIDNSLTATVDATKGTKNTFEYTDTLHNHKKRALLFSALGAFGLTASWFANKYL